MVLDMENTTCIMEGMQRGLGHMVDMGIMGMLDTEGMDIMEILPTDLRLVVIITIIIRTEAHFHL